jgi:hypothetical protein
MTCVVLYLLQVHWSSVPRSLQLPASHVQQRRYAAVWLQRPCAHIRDSCFHVHVSCVPGLFAHFACSTASLPHQDHKGTGMTSN